VQGKNTYLYVFEWVIYKIQTLNQIHSSQLVVRLCIILKQYIFINTIKGVCIFIMLL